MINTLYEPFRHWSDGGSVWILSDLHFEDDDCRIMAPDWIKPEEQINIINSLVHKNDTFLCLGDVGKAEHMQEIRARKKILLIGNHDRKSDVEPYFDEIYTGPLFISEKILISHEPVFGLEWCVNIHGHDHSGMERGDDRGKRINLCANVCGYTPVNLGELIKAGIMSDIKSIHRTAIDNQIVRKEKRKSKYDDEV